MKFTYLSAIICLFLTTTVLAEMDYFIAPGPNAHYKAGDTVSFVVEDMPDEDDQNINANLHKSDGSYVKTIQTWSSQNVDESGEEFPFQWLVDVTEGGEYYVEIRVGTNRDDATQSYPFTVEVDGESSAESDDAAAAAPIDDDPQSSTAPESAQGAYDQESEESGEKEEEPAKNKLSLHNTHSKVAHISSHNDIDTVSDSSPPPADQPSQQKHQKAKQEVTHETSSKLANVGKVAAELTSKLPIGHNQIAAPANLDNSKLAILPSKSNGKTEPLMPQTKSSASMKDLAAADEIAIEQEKKWIEEQKKGSPSAAAPSSGHTKEKPASKTSPKGKKPQPPHTKAKSKHTPPKAEAKKVTDVAKPKGLTDQIKAKAKETVDKVKQQAKQANQQNMDRQKLTLAQQEALDDQAAKKELESIKKSNSMPGDAKTKSSSPKEKRDAYRKIMGNRAKFAKQSLQ